MTTNETKDLTRAVGPDADPPPQHAPTVEKRSLRCVYGKPSMYNSVHTCVTTGMRSSAWCGLCKHREYLAAIAALKAASDELVLRVGSPLRVQIDAAIAKSEGRS